MTMKINKLGQTDNCPCPIIFNTFNFHHFKSFGINNNLSWFCFLQLTNTNNETDLSEIRKGFAPVVVTPMTGEGDKPCDGVFNGGGLGKI